MLYDSTAVATLETKSGNGWVDTLTLGVPQLNALGLISNVKLLLNKSGLITTTTRSPLPTEYPFSRKLTVIPCG